MKPQEEQEVRTQVERVRERLQGLAADLSVVDGQAESLAPRRVQHELLDQACGSLEKLDELGAASLFWGEQIEPQRAAEQLRGVRSVVSSFQAQLDEIERQRQAILTDIGREEEDLEILGEDLYWIREAEERRKLEWIVERDISAVPRRTQQMAWARGGEDDRRFHKSLAASLLVSLFLGALLPMIDLPLPKRFLPEDVPKRIVQLVRPAPPKPLPRPPVAETPPEQAQPEPQEAEPVEQPEAPAVAAAEPEPSAKPGPLGPEPPAAKPKRAVAKAGILAFRDKFASLAKDDVAPRLGADARYGNSEDASKAALPSRSMLTTNAPGSSGGINLSSLSRNVGGGGGGPGGGGGGGIHGVQVGRPTSSITGIGGGGGRPLAGDPQAASRTDEEIQIVFDRYKASFYRLYNRELRKDPTLRGQMVLRLTIEPDGSVSMCVLQSTDMDAPELSAQVVNRVRSINFGAKDDVEALTIVYPIDFLPKA